MMASVDMRSTGGLSFCHTSTWNWRNIDMIVRCTQTLLEELKIKPTEEEGGSNPFWSWHAKLFHIERRKCVLLSKDSQTPLSLTLKC